MQYPTNVSGNQTLVYVCFSVEMKEKELRDLFYLIYHLNPIIFIRLVITN